MMILTQHPSEESGSPPDGSVERLISVPAKAMLFGEYGVLEGGAAVAVTWPSYRMTLRIRRPSLSEEQAAGGLGCVWFESALLSSQLVLDAQGSCLSMAHESAQSPDRFVARALGALLELFGPPHSGLVVQVTDSFHPGLGFGSSSALLVGLYLAFLEAHEPGSTGICAAAPQNRQAGARRAFVLQSWPLHWPRLHQVLRTAQGNGSGYDIGVQFWAALSLAQTALPQLWVFRPGSGGPGHLPLVRELDCPLFWRGCGHFVESLASAATGQVLADLDRQGSSVSFDRHSALAEEAIRVIEDTEAWEDWIAHEGAKAHPLSAQVSACLHVAQEQGIAGHIEPMIATEAWTRAVIDYGGRTPIFKTMGAGRGDCVWVLPARPQAFEPGLLGVPGPQVIRQIPHPLLKGKEG
jgi:hypothetical protein